MPLKTATLVAPADFHLPDRFGALELTPEGDNS